MDLEADAVAESVTEVLAVAGALDEVACDTVELAAARTGP